MEEDKEQKTDDSKEEVRKEEKEHDVDVEMKRKHEHIHIHEKKEHPHAFKKHYKPANPIKIKKTTMWQAAAVILGILLIISVTTNKCDSADGAAVSAEEAGEKATSFISSVLLEGQQEAMLKGISKESNIYKVNFEVDGREYPSYVSTDGKLLFLQQAIDMDEAVEEPPAPEITKSDKPKVEVFVMSHCPYGTQVEKGILPVAELLGDKIDFSVRFVYYAMHGKTELDEQLNQYCIQKEFNDEYIDYLICFLGEGKGAECINETGIDKAALEACVEETDAEFTVTEQFNNQSTWLNGRFPLFDVDKAVNEQYDVKGSPHLVINGDTASTGRDAESLLKAVCSSFNNAPEECDTQLSSASPSPGFGFEGTGGSDAGTCG